MQENRERKGKNYESSRLLILGESIYSWEEDGEIMHPNLDHSTDVIEWINKNWYAAGRASFLRRVTRALARKNDPSEQERQDAWDTCAFTNYVNESVGIGAGTRPSVEMFARAEKPFLTLLERLSPSRIIVLGKEMWDNMPSTAAFFTHDIQAYALPGDALAWALALAHPRAPGNLDWETLGNTIAFFRSLNLPATMTDFREAVVK